MPIPEKTNYPLVETPTPSGVTRSLRQLNTSLSVATLTVFILVNPLSPSVAQERFDWIEFIFDKKPYAPRKINERLSYGVTFELEAEAARNRNLDSSDDEDEDEDEVQASINLGFLYDTDAHFRAYAEFELSQEVALNREKNDTSGTKLEVNEAYVTAHNRDKNLAFTLGRWSVSDEREWLFDEEIDGAQFVWRGSRVALEAMYAREQLVQKDLFGDHDNNEPDYYYARLSTRIFDQGVVGIYGLYQQGRKPGDGDLHWIGGSLSAKTENDTRYWAEAAMAQGDEGGRDVRGYGLDVGVTRTFMNSSWEPRLTASIAFGSGDDGTGTDTAYRQTGIQGNEGRFGGRKSFKYYGEVFNPELSNMGIITLGAGFDLGKKSTIDFVYHNYFQHRASNNIRKSNLDEKPSGNSRQLGNELDVVIGIREYKNLEIDFVAGVFMPGSAFTTSDDAAWFAGIRVEKVF